VREFSLNENVKEEYPLKKEANEPGGKSSKASGRISQGAKRQRGEKAKHHAS